MPQSTLDNLPVINFSTLSHATEAEHAELVRAVKKACCEIGFFFATGTGVRPETVQTALQAARDFFHQPQSFKDETAASNSPLHRGYTSLGGAHNCSPSYGRQADQKETFVIGADGHASPMHGPNQWPREDILPGWKNCMDQFWKEMLEASRIIARGIALSLQLDETFFEDKLRNPVAQQLLLRYPPPTPCSGQQVGCGEHTDCGFLTLLVHDGEGLEVCTSKGSWITAPVIPDALVVNLGDLAHFWTNDQYQSTPHRVYNRLGRDRYSIAFFCNADFDAEVDSSIACVTSQQKPKYDKVTAGPWVMQKLGIMYDGWRGQD